MKARAGDNDRGWKRAGGQAVAGEGGGRTVRMGQDSRRVTKHCVLHERIFGTAGLIRLAAARRQYSQAPRCVEDERKKDSEVSYSAWSVVRMYPRERTSI